MRSCILIQDFELNILFKKYNNFQLKNLYDKLCTFKFHNSSFKVSKNTFHCKLIHLNFNLLLKIYYVHDLLRLETNQVIENQIYY